MEAFEEAIKNPPDELLAYNLPITKIIEDNCVKDIQQEEDAFILSILGSTDE